MTVELDLQEQTRRNDTYVEINRIIDAIGQLSVFPSLTWVYTWDIVKDKLDYYHASNGEDTIINPRLTEKDVWDLFWAQADKNGFTLEYGVEDLHDHVYDWMAENDILIDYSEVDEEDGDAVESGSGEE